MHPRSTWGRSLAFIAIAMAVGACDDTNDTPNDTGPVIDVGDDDAAPPGDMSPDPEPDAAPDMAPPDMQPPDMQPPECADDIDCAVDSICAVGRCVEGECTVEPIEGCCTDDAECDAGETCDLDENRCVAGDPCADVACDTPPAPTCDDDGRRVTYAVEGTCAVVEGNAECTYEETVEDCAEDRLCVDGECVADTAIDDCRYVGPIEAEAFAGTPITLTGLVFEDGLTTETDGVDLDPALVGEAGWGPIGAAADDPGWTWIAAEPDPAWDAAGAGEPGFDQYLATFDAPDPGFHALAFRFSRDGGATWTACDLDGAANGFDPEQTGALTSLPSPCAGDPCAPQPPPGCDGDVAVTYAPGGACEAVDGEAVCTYEEVERVDCAAAGGRCDAGACVDLAPNPAAGELVITEILYDALDPLTDEGAEWFEVYNAADGPRFLGGCAVYDDGGNATDLDGGLVGPGEWLLFAISADPDRNGGLEPDLLFDFRLGNDGDTVGLRCGDVVIDEVTYGGADFPTVSARSISLDPGARDAVANDAGRGWCPAQAAYYRPGEASAHFGTPGAANPACPAPAVDFCRLQFPETVRAEAGSGFDVFGVVYEPGLTDASPQVDPIEGLVAQAGIGPDDSDPADNADWSWTDAAPNPAWDGGAAGQPNNDEYLARLTVPPIVGEYDYAFRFSLDAGTTWTYCDRAPGSTDGYQAARAGQLTATPVGGDPCDDFVCPAPPPPRCAPDGVTVIVPQPPGLCEAVGGQAACSYAEDRLGCPAGDRCLDGVCFTPGPAPQPGEIVVSEFVYDAVGALVDAGAEWVELHNPTGVNLGLDGCELADDGGNASPLDGINVPAGGYVVLARSDVPAENGGLVVAGTFDFGLGNDGDRIVVRCGGVEIDAVAYDPGGTFPVAEGYSVALDPDALDADANDTGTNWCRALPVYFQSQAGDHHGTPGAPNPQCPAIGNCVLLAPDDIAVAVGEDVPAAALVVAAGVTDATRGVDADVRLRAAAGYGPAGSDPAVDPGWQWFPAAGDPANDAQNADTYLGAIPAPAPGRYDVAFRFSVDDGRTYTWCDRAPGAVDGYRPADAGHVVVGDPADPCDPNPCDSPPADVCAGPDTLLTYAPIGQCTPDGGVAACEYAEQPVDCPLGCVDGACVQPAPRAPQPGEVVISEILYDPHDGLDDNTAEWFELYNATDDRLDLGGCTFADAANQGDVGPVVLEPRSYTVFARSADPALNGGLEVAGVFDFGLNNTDDTLTVACGGVVIDRVSYDEADDGAYWPPVRAFAIQVRDGALDAVANDDSESWCPARTRYSEDPAQWGSPGAPNPPCDSEVDFCRLQFPTDLSAEFETVQIFYGRVYEEGVTDLGPRNDGTGLFLAELGYGPDGSLPDANPDWAWARGFDNADYDGSGPLGEPNNDEYRVDVPMPVPGEYDTAFRFSVDGGRTWRYCDAGEAGSSDGYRVEDAGRLVVTAPENPCEPNPCDAPPAAFCEGNTAITYPAVGVCGVDALGLATCDYPEEAVDCGDQICVAGACGGARPPQPGEVIVSELLYDPQDALAEDAAEWIELYNTTEQPLSLDGCEIADAASGDPIIGVEIPARGYALFARTDDPARNGGLAPDGLFGFALTNGGDTVSLRCGGQLIDSVTYDDGGLFPDARAASISLSADRLTADANDLGGNWCVGVDLYIAQPPHRGTPGGPNPACDLGDPCDPNPCADAPAAFCDGDVAVRYGPTPCEVVDGQAQCIPPDEIREDCGPGNCLDGQCDIGGARPPAEGEVIITEIMFDTDGELNEGAAEWFEVHNVTGVPLDLDGCEVRDRANGLAVAGLIIPAGGELLFARSNAPAVNGGLVPDGVFNFSLNNNGDIVELRCGGATIDAVDYALAGFPAGVPAVALQLDVDLYDHELNDLGDAWCNADPVYYPGATPHYGTPGALNPACGDDVGACDPNPCDQPPDDECLDAENVAAYDPRGTCELVDGAPVCDYGFELVECGAIGQVCAAGRCVPPDAVAGEGDVIISELMYDPHFALDDATAEWIELYNTTDRQIILDGCDLAVEGGPDPLRLSLTMDPGAYALLARSLDPALNGGLVGVAQVFLFALGNNGARLELRCADTLIDAVAYDDGFTYPDAQAASISLDPDAFDAISNDQGARWCLGDTIYFADPGGAAEQDHLGTPGQPNPICPEVDVTVDYCRFNFPVVATRYAPAAGVPPLDMYGVVYEAGITDQSTLVDFDGRLRGEAGYGPRGSDPDGNAAWRWIQAAPNVGWDGAARGEPNNDEYIAQLDGVGVVGGEYDMAYRFTRDDGQTWLYCDLDGSPNGYSAEQAVDLTIEVDPCAGVFCFDPPPAGCENATTLVFYDGLGECVPQPDGTAECVYPVNFRQNCAQDGRVCIQGDFGANCVNP